MYLDKTVSKGRAKEEREGKRERGRENEDEERRE